MKAPHSIEAKMGLDFKPESRRAFMAKPITAEIIYELTNVSDPSISPDGTQLAFVRSRVDKESMETRSQIMLMALDDAAAVFTGGARSRR